MAARKAEQTAGTIVAVDEYISKSRPFAQPILSHLRGLVHAAVPGVEETMKWSMPFFVYRGIILANMAAFKEHCSFGIWKENVQPLMKTAEKDAGGGMGSFGKLTRLEDLPANRELKAVLLEAAGKIDRGERTKNWEGRAKKQAAVEIPEALAAALKQDEAAATRFQSMSASCRREYCDWIAEAKREETRAKRVATAMEWIAEGKQRHWKYQNC